MTSTEQFDAVSVQVLHDKAAQLRIDIVLATTEAGSGHPNSCASAAEIVSLLFFAIMRYDPPEPAAAVEDHSGKYRTAANRANCCINSESTVSASLR